MKKINIVGLVCVIEFKGDLIHVRNRFHFVKDAWIENNNTFFAVELYSLPKMKKSLIDIFKNETGESPLTVKFFKDGIDVFKPQSFNN